MQDQFRTCTRCGVTQPLDSFYRYSDGVVKRGGQRQRQCKNCMRAYHREWRARNQIDPDWVEHQRTTYREWREKREGTYPDWNANHRLSKRFYRYGLTLSDIKTLLEQQKNRCAACHNPFSNARFERPAVDHDHATGAIRGVLCVRCNIVLGQAGDGPRVLQALIAYLQRNAVNGSLALKE